MSRRQRLLLIIVLVGLLVRAWAAWLLPVDADEPVYLRAAREYAQFLRAGDVAGVIAYDFNREHPPLIKLLYSLGYLLLPVRYDAQAQWYAARALSVLFGTLTVALVAAVEPIAGAFLALHSMTIKYTAEAYLEALPQLTVLIAVLALRRAPRHRRWWWVSAIALGITAAGKLTYLVVVPALAYLLWQQRPLSWKRVAGYGAVALGTFWLLTPSLWRAPWEGVWQMLTFHAAYTHSSDVLRAAYPWYQPVLWIINDVPWHPNVFFFLTSDRYVIWFMLPGLVLAWRRGEGWMSVWFVTALATLLVWPTKWPQYTLTLTVPLCLLGGLALHALVDWVKAFNDYWGWLDEVVPRPPKWALVVAVLFITALTAGQVQYEVEMALGRRGWAHFTEDTAPLLSNAVYDVAAGKDGQVAFATAKGVTLWRPGENFPWANGATHFTAENSPLRGAVTSVLAARDGSWWFGTDEGLFHYDGAHWQAFRAAKLGLPEARVRALFEDATGQLWVGTLRGIAVGGAAGWRSLPELGETAVFAITGDAKALWIGSTRGVSRFELTAQRWRHWERDELGLVWGGVTDVALDSAGTVWVATQGDGALRWDGSSWQHFTVGDGLPSNTLRCVLEMAPNTVWIGAGFPTEPGGLLATWDGTRWRKLSARNSGFAGFEPVAMARDETGQLWIATATGGVQSYRPPVK